MSAAPGSRRRPRLGMASFAVVVVGLLSSSRISRFATDLMWFDSVGFGDVFWTVLGTKVALGVGAGALVAGVVAGNLLLTQRLAPADHVVVDLEDPVERYRALLEPVVRPLMVAVALLLGLLAGLAIQTQWSTYLLWRHGGTFGRVDPQFGRDLGWFVFDLPMLTLVNSFAFGLLALTIGLSALAHYLLGGIRPQVRGNRITPRANAHLSVLLAALVAVRAWGFVLDQYQLSYSTRGEVMGLTYTDANASLVAYRLLAVIAVVCVVLFGVNVRFRGWLLPSAGVGILAVSAVVLSGIYPAVIQRVQVAPQELERERAYIQRNLELTRFAHGLDEVDTRSFPANSSLTAEQVAANRTTLESVRLWDPPTLQRNYQQLQELRPYYDFVDVDVDRYVIDGDPRQVMVSARELNEERVPSQTWQNRRLVYTHGYGMVASEVSSASPEGQPNFLVRDLPPVGVEELQVDNPRIYFGERSPTYSIVGAKGPPELDYPEADGTRSFTYDGADGIRLTSVLRRLAFALRYREPNFVLSGLLDTDSRVLVRRDIRERVLSVAPFLTLDGDPYPVAADGRIQWVLDAYTRTDMVPYSQRVDLGRLTTTTRVVLVTDPDGTVREERRQVANLTGRANYLRNSVKAVVDAYDGTISLYAADVEDPILAAWQRTFPGSFTPLEGASDELRSHFRYPEDLLRVQAALYAQYHIPDADGFYLREDAWKIPQDAVQRRNLGAIEGLDRPLRPTYQLIRLPGREEERFTLVQPFVPTGEDRTNLIAYLAAEIEPDGTTALRTFTIPPTRTVLGPEQVLTRVLQDPIISQEMTLLDQRGSKLLFGDLLVVPVEDSLLYTLPIFLSASEQSDIPELRRVIVVFGDRVVMRNSLQDAVAAVFGAEDTAPSQDVAALLDQAADTFTRADAALAAGDLGGYQAANADARELLEQAQRLLSQTSAG